MVESVAEVLPPELRAAAGPVQQGCCGRFFHSRHSDRPSVMGATVPAMSGTILGRMRHWIPAILLLFAAAHLSSTPSQPWRRICSALSGLRHKYDDVRCAQFGLWRGARRAHPLPGAVTDEQRRDRPNSAQPAGRKAFFAQTSLFAPSQPAAGMLRRSRLVWAKNPLPRTSSYLCLRPLRLRSRLFRVLEDLFCW